MTSKEYRKGKGGLNYASTGKLLKIKEEESRLDRELDEAAAAVEVGCASDSESDSVSGNGVLRKTSGSAKKEKSWVGLRDGNFRTGDCIKLHLPGSGGQGIEMIYCEPGSFMMGSPQDEEGRSEDELLHHVTLTKGFWLSRYPVTFLQWKCVIGKMSWAQERFLLGKFQSYTRNKPIRGVTWQECKEFCDRLNVKCHCGARMPTEAEWEYACRAGTVGRYGGTGTLDEMGRFGVAYPQQESAFAETRYSTYRDERENPCRVGTKNPNKWGFFDMHGLVCEICSDWYGDYPDGGVLDPAGPKSGDSKVVRGGCIHSKDTDCRCAFRGKVPWLRSTDEEVFCDVGFRLCCSA